MMLARVNSLAARLTAGIVVLIIGTCGAVGFAAAVGVNRFLLARIDRELVTLAETYQTLEASDEIVVSPLAGILLVRLQGNRIISERVLRTTHHEPQELSDADRQRIIALPAQRSKGIKLDEVGSYRLRKVPKENGETLVMGLPAHPATSVVGRLVLVELVGITGVGLLAGIVGSMFVRRSLRPLQRVTAAASSVVEQDLSSGMVALPARVSERDGGTEVAKVAAAVNAMLTHVEKALNLRLSTEARLRRFLADASHELRTPLAVIRSHSELARRNMGAHPDQALRSLGRVETETTRMGQLVDDLLLLARLDAGRPLARERLDLTRLVIDAVTDAQAADPHRCWVLKLSEEPVEIEGDPGRLHQVVLNLLANASAHTPAGTTVTVTLQDPHLRDQMVVLNVADNGPGIPPELQPQVFDRFTRGDDSRSRSSHGTGLGLAIASAVVSAHGGTIDVESKPGDTCMTVRLPR